MVAEPEFAHDPSRRRIQISIVQTTMSTHAPPQETEIEESDPVIAKIQKTGCLEKHYAVLVSK